MIIIIPVSVELYGPICFWLLRDLLYPDASCRVMVSQLSLSYALLMLRPWGPSGS